CAKVNGKCRELADGRARAGTSRVREEKDGGRALVERERGRGGPPVGGGAGFSRRGHASVDNRQSRDERRAPGRAREECEARNGRSGRRASGHGCAPKRRGEGGPTKSIGTNPCAVDRRRTLNLVLGRQYAPGGARRADASGN